MRPNLACLHATSAALRALVPQRLPVLAEHDLVQVLPLSAHHTRERSAVRRKLQRVACRQTHFVYVPPDSISAGHGRYACAGGTACGALSATARPAAQQGWRLAARVRTRHDGPPAEPRQRADAALLSAAAVALHVALGNAALGAGASRGGRRRRRGLRAGARQRVLGRTARKRGAARTVAGAAPSGPAAAATRSAAPRREHCARLTRGAARLGAKPQSASDAMRSSEQPHTRAEHGRLAGEARLRHASARLRCPCHTAARTLPARAPPMHAGRAELPGRALARAFRR